MEKPSGDHPATTEESALYPRALGDRWELVHEAVRRPHLGARRARAAGLFRVQNGHSMPARLLLRLFRLPGEGENVPVRLLIVPRSGSERWFRQFGTTLLRSTQRCDGRETVCESFPLGGAGGGRRRGRLEIRFRLQVLEGGLEYTQIGAAVCLGRIRARLPGWLAPRVRALEGPGAEPDRMRVRVEVRLPGGGLLLSYEGVVRTR